MEIILTIDIEENLNRMLRIQYIFQVLLNVFIPGCNKNDEIIHFMKDGVEIAKIGGEYY